MKVEVELHIFLHSVLDRLERWGARPRIFNTREAAHCILRGKACGTHSRSGELKVIPFQAMEVHWGSWGKAPLILNLGTKWRRVVKFISGCFTPGKETRWPMNRRMGAPQSMCGLFGYQINLFPLLSIEIHSLGRPARSLFTVPAGLQSCAA